MSEDRSEAEPVFVGREPELGRLGELWSGVRAVTPGSSRVAFVMAEAGVGKTSLLRTFAARVRAGDPEVAVAVGTCNDHGGLGDPYLPFREILSTLTGTLDAPADSTPGTDPARAGRMKRLRRSTVSTVAEIGPDLVPLLIGGVPGIGLGVALYAGRAVTRQTAARRHRKSAPEAPAPAPAPEVDTGPDQSRLFGQFTDFLTHVSDRQPLLLLLDDLHWADAASLSLLFHLARRLDDSRVLIIGAYRPEEVALAGGDERHPLEKVVSELKRSYGDVCVDLARGSEQEGRPFVDAIIDSEPNCLDEHFRRSLFDRTGGHALFTIELLRAMQDRGDLVRDSDDRWVEGPALDWAGLPARVEGVIEERVGRLSAEHHDLLQVASVEGLQFTAQILGRVSQVAERRLVRDLGQELGKRHRLVREAGESLAGTAVVARYQFSHALFQEYLYDELSAAERRVLHREIAEAIEDLYADDPEDVVVQLARHYGVAGEAEKAITYLLYAGDRARALYAYEEAIDAYERALVFLTANRDHERAARTLMKLGLTHHIAFDFPAARRCYDDGFALWQRATAGGAPVAGPASQPLRIQWRQPDILDPALCADIWSGAVISQLFSGLVQITAEMEVVPDAAEHWEVSDEGRRYVFRLRRDLRWSDGVAVTAADFEFAWKRVLDPETASGCAVILYAIAGARAFNTGSASADDVGVHAVDAVTLVVDLEQPATYLPYLLTFCPLYPVPRHAVAAHGSSWSDVGKIVTNGPFLLDSWEDDRSLVLSRNPAYPGRARGNVARVELSLSSSGHAAEAYDAGTVDVLPLHDLPSGAQARLRRDHAGDYASIPALFTTFAAFDTTIPPFHDVRVRRAFVLAVDAEAFSDVVMAGAVFPATGGLTPKGMPGHTPGIALGCDHHEARRLLAEAGFPDGVGFPPVHGRALGSVNLAAAFLAESWRRTLGVEVTWDETGFRESLRSRGGRVMLMSWVADYPDPDNFLRLYLDRYLVGASPEVARLVAEAGRATDQSRRMDLYRQADTVLVTEAYCLPLAYNRFQLLVRPTVRSLPTSASSFWFWKDVVLGSP